MTGNKPCSQLDCKVDHTRKLYGVENSICSVFSVPMKRGGESIRAWTDKER